MLTRDDVLDICLRLENSMESAIFEHVKLGRFLVCWSHNNNRFHIQLMGTTTVVARRMTIRNHSLVFTDDSHESVLSMGLDEVEFKFFVWE